MDSAANVGGIAGGLHVRASLMTWTVNEPIRVAFMAVVAGPPMTGLGPDGAGGGHERAVR